MNKELEIDLDDKYSGLVIGVCVGGFIICGALGQYDLIMLFAGILVCWLFVIAKTRGQK
jgi:hypothetical protein